MYLFVRKINSKTTVTYFALITKVKNYLSRRRMTILSLIGKIRSMCARLVVLWHVDVHHLQINTILLNRGKVILHDNCENRFLGKYNFYVCFNFGQITVYVCTLLVPLLRSSNRIVSCWELNRVIYDTVWEPNRGTESL